MSDPPGGIDLSRHRDLERRKGSQWARHAFLVLLVAFLVAALLNAFGQRAETSTAESPAASLSVTSPERVRGGLLYQARFRIHAFRELKRPVLVLDRSWLDETTVNTLQPEPVGTTSTPGAVKFRFDPLQAGRTLVVYLSLQANPTNVGSHDADVSVYDGSSRLVSIHRTQLNLP